MIFFFKDIIYPLRKMSVTRAALPTPTSVRAALRVQATVPLLLFGNCNVHANANAHDCTQEFVERLEQCALTAHSGEKSPFAAL